MRYFQSARYAPEQEEGADRLLEWLCIHAIVEKEKK